MLCNHGTIFLGESSESTIKLRALDAAIHGSKRVQIVASAGDVATPVGERCLHQDGTQENVQSAFAPRLEVESGAS